MLKINKFNFAFIVYTYEIICDWHGHHGKPWTCTYNFNFNNKKSDFI